MYLLLYLSTYLDLPIDPPHLHHMELNVVAGQLVRGGFKHCLSGNSHGTSPKTNDQNRQVIHVQLLIPGNCNHRVVFEILVGHAKTVLL